MATEINKQQVEKNIERVQIDNLHSCKKVFVRARDTLASERLEIETTT